MAVVFSSKVSGTDIAHPALADIVPASDRVARVRILKHRDATFSYGGEEYRCGVIFTARVIDPLKGGKKGFVFLATTENDFDGAERDYLVFVLKSASLAAPYSNALSGLEGERVRCRLEAAPFLLDERVQTMIPFDPDAPIEYGREWLRVDQVSAISTLPMEEIKIDDHEYGFVQWSIAKEAIIEAIRSRPRIVSQTSSSY